MGACLSMAPAHLLEATDGDEEAYHQRYIEDQVLGQGAFGVVKMVHDMRKKDEAQASPLACKSLRKGATFKDNTLYSPIKPEILRGEIEILRALRGERFCMKLEAVFETPRDLLVVTEFCGGGEMMEYVSKQTEDLRTEDVSRIAFQLLSALDHCATNGVIHRDLKPENVMFVDPSPGAELRLIDFGSGTMDSPSRPEDELHTTFAGSAFYISPELFQRTYNFRTDVWSAAVVLYVLVAGYPSDCLQKAFNILQKGPGRTLKELPNLPEDLPDSFYELLEEAMTYQFTRRPSAGKLLQNEFVQFHQNLNTGMSIDEISAVAAATTNATEVAAAGSTGRRTASLSVRGSVRRHTAFIGFKNFERSLTTLLATMLAKNELRVLLEVLKQRLDEKYELEVANITRNGGTADVSTGEDGGAAINPLDSDSSSRQLRRLHVVKVDELKNIIKRDVQNSVVLTQMEKLPNESMYGAFAYNVSLLKDFASEGDGLGIDSAGRKRMKRRGSLNRTNSVGRSAGTRASLPMLNDSSVHSTHSLSARGGGIFASSTAGTQQPSSVHGSNVFGGTKR